MRLLHGMRVLLLAALPGALAAQDRVGGLVLGIYALGLTVSNALRGLVGVRY